MSDENETLDAQGIQVRVNHTDERGSLIYNLPLGGGTVNEMDSRGLIIEVEPQVEMPRGRWRSYDAIALLAAQVEKQGGYVRSGDTIHVGGEILVGRDMIELLVYLNRRANEREGGKRDEVSYEQGRSDALREVAEMLEQMS